MRAVPLNLPAAIAACYIYQDPVGREMAAGQALKNHIRGFFKLKQFAENSKTPVYRFRLLFQEPKKTDERRPNNVKTVAATRMICRLSQNSEPARTKARTNSR